MVTLVATGYSGCYGKHLDANSCYRCCGYFGLARVAAGYPWITTVTMVTMVTEREGRTLSSSLASLVQMVYS